MQSAGTWHIAVDLGAESGRVMLGRVDASCGRIDMREVHRFATARFSIGDSHHWDVPAIFDEILAGLAKAAQSGEAIASVSVDSWGVDYVLLAEGEPFLAPPFMYRDPRTDAVFARVQADEAIRRAVYEETGIQFLNFNTLYQLLADLERPDGRALHDSAAGMLLMGDYFNWRLCGVAKAERSLASTSQLYNPRARTWSAKLIEMFSLRKALCAELADSGTALGPLLDEVAGHTALRGAQVLATCSHDTAAAVAATPLAGDASAYLSSGTWSLLGVELGEPIISDESRQLGFTNEVAFGHSIRLLKNISGLFILQECRRDFAAEGHELDYAALAEMARAAEPMRSLIRPDAAQFAKVGDMTRRIAQYCGATGQPAPETPAQFARCVYDSLALLYAETLGQIELLTGRKIHVINVVGGGSRSELLNQLTADACGVGVEAGPAEATALGNIGIQAIATGALSGIAELRALVRQCFPPRRLEPAAQRSEARARFAALPARAEGRD